MTGTPYDDVFRTLLNDCPALIVPVINEIFGLCYSGQEEICFFPNEHFLNRQDGGEEERITDTCFEIQGEPKRKYHLECQSTEDKSMLIRFFEYDTQIALDAGGIRDNVLYTAFPYSAVLYLRQSSSTPDKLKIRIRASEDSLEHSIYIMKIQAYTAAMIFQQRLLFLIPFYIFSHEKYFRQYEAEGTRLEALKEDYKFIRNELEQLCENGEIDEYTKCTIIDMSNKVLEHIAEKYGKVKEGVKDIMGGKILEYEAKTIKNEGITQGISQGKLMTYMELVRDGLLTIEEAAHRLHKNTQELEGYLRMTKG